MNKQKIKPGDHRTMILNPWEWPCYPRLPLKKKAPGQTWPDMAFLLAHEDCMSALDSDHVDPDKPFTIYLGLMYGKPAEMLTITYDNVDALLSAGWEVD
jgi:hypothetical protein